MKRVAFTIFLVGILLLQLVPNLQSSAGSLSITNSKSDSSILLQAGQPPLIERSEETGMVTFIGSADGMPIPVPAAMRSSNSQDQRTESILEQYAPMFGIQNSDTELAVEKIEESDNGHVYERYQQVFNGIPVIAGEIIVNRSSTGGLYSMSGEASPNLSLSTMPDISSEEARSQAQELMLTRYGIAAADLSISAPALWIYDERLLRPSTKPAKLVWRMEARDKNGGPIDAFVLVDAIHGGISLEFNQVDTDLSNTTNIGQSEITDGKSHNKNSTIPVNSQDSMPQPVHPIDSILEEDQSLHQSEIPSVSTSASIFYVSPAGTDGTNTCITKTSPCKTIDYAVSQASAGSLIYVGEGTYSYDGFGHGPVFATAKDLTLLGGWDSGFSNQIGFTTLDGQGVNYGIYIAGVTVTISKFLIENGFNSNGGAIYNSSGQLTLNDSIVRMNRASLGGGIYSSGIATINNSIIDDNIASAGGGIYIPYTISGPAPQLNVNASVISNNQASNGGGIFGYGTTFEYTLVNVNNSTITANSASQDGGGIYGSSNTNLKNTTISENSAARSGGGIYVYQLTMNLWNTILAGNTASTSGPDCAGPNQIVSYGHNLLGNNAGCSFSATIGDILNTNPQLAPFISALGYYPLLSSSPARNAGDPASCLPTDQRGVVRDSQCDIGSYEYTVPGPASKLALISGSPQHAYPLSIYSKPFKVAALDTIGTLVSDIMVQFTAPASGPSGSFSDPPSNTASVLTDVYGIATAPTFTANNLEGAYTLVASVSGSTSTVDFSLENRLVNWYITPDGSDSSDCLSPATSCKTLSAVFGKPAFLPGDRVYFGAGTYTGTASPISLISKDVFLSGGWNSSFTSQDGISIIDNHAINVDYGREVKIESFIIQNSYGSTGGGISNNGDLTLINVALYNNAASNGGGIANNGTLHLSNVTITKNQASSGGGIYMYGGSADIHFSTITDNTASSGGGIYVQLGSVSIDSVILTKNTGSPGPGVDCSGGIFSADYNLIGDTNGCTISLQPHDQTTVAPQLGTYIPARGYLPILANSPAVDAGSLASCPTVDVRHLSRPVDGNGDGSSLCDIGAYEYKTPGSAAIYYSLSSTSETRLSAYDLSTPFQVMILDSLGSPVSGSSVNFSVPESGPGGNFIGGTNTITATSNVAGVASAVLSANIYNGNYILQAAPEGLAETFSYPMLNSTWFVDPSGSDSNSCWDSTTPCATINGVIAKFVQGDKILVRQATYAERSDRDEAILVTIFARISGGWDASFTNQIGMSMIDGQGIHSCMTIDQGATIDHFIFENGRLTSDYNYSGGIDVKGFYVTLRDSIIRDNVNAIKGGGIYSAGVLTLENVLLQNNESEGDGGGIYLGFYSKHSSIRDSSFINNNAPHGSGGAIYSDYNDFLLENSTLYGNRASAHGNGVYATANSASSPIHIRNSTIVGQELYYQPYTGIDFDVQNSILKAVQAANITSLGNNLIFKGSGWTPSGSDITAVNPLLTPLIPGGFFALIANSPAINAANNTVCPADDQLGSPRPFGGGCDIGAIEYTGPGTVPAYILPYPDTNYYIGLGQISPQPFKALLLDARGNGVSNYSATFTAPASGASGVFTDNGTQAFTTQTDNAGTAISGTFQANNIYGVYQLVLSLAGFESDLPLQVTNGPAVRTYTNQNQLDDFLPGVLLCTEADAVCTPDENEPANDAQLLAMQTSSFYILHHSRIGLDGNGMPILSTVHYGTDYSGAFWDGSEVVYGNSTSITYADDLVAHLITYGITQHTSNLFYYYQSGAISESIANMWGEFVDQTNGFGTDVPSVKWLIGEDSTVLENMADPPQFSKPDRMTSSLYHKGDQDDLLIVAYDNGGVHKNSGVNDKAVYLMTDGDTFNGYTIQGIGLDKVAAIYYQAQTHLLTSGSDYKDLYYALQESCSNLVGGSEGITSANCVEVKKALDAVEMNKDPLTNFMPEATLCPGQDEPVDLLFDDFETPNSNWDYSNHIPTGISWQRSPGYATSGTYSLYGPDTNVTSNITVSMTNPVAIPSSGNYYLYFNHAFGFEFGFEYDPDANWIFGTWDGGVLEYKIDSGSWQDSAELLNSGQGYNGTVYSYTGGTNPLAGRNAFVRDSHGYVSSKFNLNTAAIRGHQIQFRWMIGSDDSVGGTGWVIDDVHIYTCQPLPSPQQIFLPAIFR